MSESTEVAVAVNRSVVAYQAHAFSSFTHFTQATAGQSVGDMVRALGLPEAYQGFVHVWLNDLPVEHEEWDRTVPTEGQMVYVRVIPQGGGSGKDILRTIAAIAIAVVAIYVAPVIAGTGAMGASMAGMSLGAQIGTALVAAGITVVGNLALNALIPPPKPDFDAGGGLGSQKNQLTGSSNRFAPYAPIPRIFGKRRIYPLLAGRPYSETQGDDEYLRMALLVGWGPLQITDLRIGDTPITSFSDVQYEVREGWGNDQPLTLYTSTIVEAGYAILLDPPTNPIYDGETGELISAGGTSYSIRTTEPGTTEISVDVSAPAGLAKFKDNGKRESINVDVQVRYAVTGSGNWQTPVWLNDNDPGLDQDGRLRMSGADTSSIRRTGRFSVPEGQYDVRLARTTTEFDTSKHVQEVRWTTMRSVKPSYPVQQPGVSLIALRIKATGQLSGVPQIINCVAESYLPVYNGSTWSYQLTRNPAWAFADVLRRRGNEAYLADDRLDLQSIQAWAAACDATAPNAAEPYWRFDGIVEGGSVFQALRQIAASARASYIMRDGKHSVVRDIQQTVPIQHITPRNSFGYSGSKVFLDYPHAMRVVFPNAEKNFEEDERIVYDDGYNAGNATKFETLELFGCSSSAQAFREARYHIAVARLRPEEHVIQMDVENVRCTLGDLVQFQHDVISVGIASARITSVTLNGLNQVTSFVLDQEVPIETTKSYALRARRSDGSSVVISLQSPATENTPTVVPQTPIAQSSAPTVGDLVMFGEAASVSAAMIVKRIEPGPDLTATLRLVDAQSGVYTADNGAIPAFNSNITIVTPIADKRPAAVSITQLRSDESALLILSDGTLQDRIAVTLSLPQSNLLRVDSFEVQWRAEGAAVWEAQRFLRGAPIYLSPVQSGVYYEVRARAISESGLAGDWSATSSHLVVGKNAPPGDVLALAYTVTDAGIEFKWDAAADIDYATTVLKSGASWAAGEVIFDGAANKWTWVRPTTGTYTIWAKHKDTSGNVSANATTLSINYTSAGISNADVSLGADGTLIGGGGGAIDLGQVSGSLDSAQLGPIIDATKFAAGVEPVSIVAGSTLPTTKTTSTIYLAGTGKLYRWNGTVYTAAVPTADLSGTIGSAQIDDEAVVASKIADATLTTAKFASGIEPVTVVTGALPTTKSTSTIFRTDDGKTYRWNGLEYTASIPAVDISGAIVESQIDDEAVTAAKIADATLTTAKFAAGIEPVSVVSGALPTAKSTSTIFRTDDGKLYRWNGTAYVASVAASDVSGALTNDQIADIAAAKITGEVVSTQIADAAISTAKFASGIEPVGVVAALPAVSGYTGPKTVMLTTDSKLYRFTGTAWTAVVEAVDIDSRGLEIQDALGNTVFGSDGFINDNAYLNLNGNNVQLSSLAAANLTPTLNFVGTYATAPTQAQIGAQWLQNAVYRNSTDGFLYVLTGAPLAWLLYLQDGTSFVLTIESTNGTTFRVGQNTSTSLHARLFKNGAEVTSETPASWFRWRRVSGIPQASPNDDATWNANYVSGFKSVSVNVDSVFARATFFCDIIEA